MQVIATQRPGDPDGVHRGAGEEVEHQRETEQGDQPADSGQRPGAVAVTQPEPADDDHRGGVLDQQGHADLEVLDGAEVGELAAGDRDQAVGDDHPCVAP